MQFRPKEKYYQEQFLLLFWSFSITVVFAFPTFFYPIYYDQATFMYIARIWQAGLLPFKDALDTKPPGIFAFYAFADLIFGKKEYAYRLLEYLLIVSTIFPFQFILKNLVNTKKGGMLAHLIYVCIYYLGTSFTNIGQVEMLIANIGIWFLSYVMHVYLNKNFSVYSGFLAGLVSGALFLLKQPFAIIGLVYLFPLLLKINEQDKTKFFWRNVKTFVAFVSGGSFVLLIFVIYFILNDALYDLYYGMLKLPWLYSKYSNLPVNSIVDYFSLLLWNIPLLALFFYGLYRLLIEKSAINFIVLFWFFCLFAGVLIQRKLWPYHMIAIIPVVAVLVSYGLLRLRNFFLRYMPSLLVHLLFTFLLCLEGFALAFEAYRPNIYGIGTSNNWLGALQNTFSYLNGQISKTKYYATYYGGFTRVDADWLFAKKLSEYVKNGQTLQIVEFRPSLYIYTKKLAPHKYFFGTLVFLVGADEGARILDRYMRETYIVHRPDWIVFGLDGPWLSKKIMPLHPKYHGYKMVDTFLATYHPNNVIKKINFGIFKNLQVEK